MAHRHDEKNHRPVRSESTGWSGIVWCVSWLVTLAQLALLGEAAWWLIMRRQPPWTAFLAALLTWGVGHLLFSAHVTFSRGIQTRDRMEIMGLLPLGLGHIEWRNAMRRRRHGQT